MAADRIEGHSAVTVRPGERLGTHRDVFALPVEQLTPAAFKRTLR